MRRSARPSGELSLLPLRLLDAMFNARRMSWIYFENASHKPEKVDACVQSALKVLPESQLLALAIADMLEINKAYDVRTMGMQF